MLLLVQIKVFVKFTIVFMNYVHVLMVKENVFVGQWCYPKDCPKELSIVEYDPSNNDGAAAYRLVYECFNGLIPKEGKFIL